MLHDTLEWDPRNNGDDIVRIARLLVQEHALPADTTAAIECAIRAKVGITPAHQPLITHAGASHASQSNHR